MIAEKLKNVYYLSEYIALFIIYLNNIYEYVFISTRNIAILINLSNDHFFSGYIKMFIYLDDNTTIQ